MKRTVIVCVALGLLSVGPSMATTVWNPAANDIYPPDVGNWNDAANWTLGVPATPTNNDTKAVFNVDNAAECHVTDYQTGFYFVQGDGGTSNGTVVRVTSGGHIETSSVNSWSAVGYNRAAHMIVETGGEMTTASGQHLWIGLNEGGVGTVDINGGTVTCGQMLGLGWGGGLGFINVNDGGTLMLTQMHDDGQKSVQNGSLINITGTGQIVYPGSSGNTNRLNAYVANELLVANGVPEDVIINYDTNLNAVVVTAAVVIPDPPLNLTQFDQGGGTLAFEWSSIPGKQFDLISSEDLAVPVDTWAPYNDGVTTHENIPNSGTGTNTLTGVLPVGGPPRFFTVRKEFGSGVSFFSENFDESSGLPADWTSGVTAGSTSWEADTPSSVGPTAANSLSNCVATGIAANYGPNADIWLRTPEIDLTGVTEATLVFQQVIDIEPVADKGSVRVIKASNGDQLGADLLSSVGGSNAGTWEEVVVDLPLEAFGETVKIEFQFEADAVNGALWNGSFESPVLDEEEATKDDGPTWFRGRYDGTGTNWFDNTDFPGGIWNPGDGDAGGFDSIPDGSNTGYVKAKYDFDVALKQDLPINLEANTQYDINFQVGSPFANGIGGEFDKEIPDYRIELVAGGEVVASDTGASPASYVNQWAAHSLSYNSTAAPAQLGEPLEIRLVAVAKGTSVDDLDGVHNQELDFDAVTLTITPAPGSIDLAGWYIDDVEITAPIP